MSTSLAKYVSVLVILFFVSNTTVAASQDYVDDTGSKEELGLGTEKLTRLHFYVHNIYGGSPITSVIIVNQTANLSFGTVAITDDPLTITPDLSSQRVGSLQAHVVVASRFDASAFLMTNTFVFTEGKYNGSSLVVVGMNQGSVKTRELPIVGGSGVFRFARGYALTSTYSLDTKRGNDVYEYDLYVLHH